MSKCHFKILVKAFFFLKKFDSLIDLLTSKGRKEKNEKNKGKRRARWQDVHGPSLFFLVFWM